MSEQEFASIQDVWRFAENARRAAEARGLTQLAGQFYDALNLGSSALEILGAIQKIVLENREILNEVLPTASQADTQRVIAFVDAAFGRASPQ